MTRDRTNWECPACTSRDVYRVNGSERFECSDCGQVTLEKVGRRQEDFEVIAQSNLPAAELAELLLRGGT